jgi:hypothetical protein
VKSMATDADVGRAGLRHRPVPQVTSQPWCPAGLVALIHEFLVWFVGVVGAARPFVPLVDEAMARAGSRRLVDLRTGAGSGAEVLRPLLPDDVAVVPTAAGGASDPGEGARILVNGLHRLDADEAMALVARAFAERRVLLVVEGNDDSRWQAVGMLVFAPLSAVLTAPFVRPFRVARLVFTWLVPILPALIAYDGIAALYRLYNPGDLDRIFARAGGDGYRWRTGKVANGRGGNVIYGLAWPDGPPSA